MHDNENPSYICPFHWSIKSGKKKNEVHEQTCRESWVAFFLILSTRPPNYFILRNPVTSRLVYTTRIYILPPKTTTQMKTLFLVQRAHSMATQQLGNVQSLRESRQTLLQLSRVVSVKKSQTLHLCMRFHFSAKI